MGCGAKKKARLKGQLDAGWLVKKVWEQAWLSTQREKREGWGETPQHNEGRRVGGNKMSRPFRDTYLKFTRGNRPKTTRKKLRREGAREKVLGKNDRDSRRKFRRGGFVVSRQ